MKKSIILFAFILTIFWTIWVYGWVSNPFYSSLDKESIKSLDKIVEIVKNKKSIIPEETYDTLVLSIIKKLGYLYNEMVPLYSGNSSIPAIDDTNTWSEPNINLDNSVINVNAIPTNTTLDANGWPKYLNVPSECPPPEPGKKYYHYFGRTSQWAINRPEGDKFFNPIDSTQASTSWPSGRHDGYFMEVGSYFETWWHSTYPPITEEEYIAAPFMTSNASYDLRIDTVTPPPPNVDPVFQQYAISYCPWDFTWITPAWKKPLPPTVPHPNWWTRPVNKCLSSWNAFQNFFVKIDGEKKLLGCNLEANTKYFFNVRNKDFTEECSDWSVWSDICLCSKRERYKRNWKPVCWLLMASRGYITTSKPYAWPCLSKPPYPINYNSRTCGQIKLDSPCSDEPSSPLVGSSEWICTDTEWKLPTQVFKYECVNSKLKWTQGYNKPMYNTYLCEKTYKGKADMRRTICSELRKNQKRTEVCRDPQWNSWSNRPQTVTGDVQQCIFENWRYDWKTIEENWVNSQYRSCTWSEPTL